MKTGDTDMPVDTKQILVAGDVIIDHNTYRGGRKFLNFAAFVSRHRNT